MTITMRGAAFILVGALLPLPGRATNPAYVIDTLAGPGVRLCQPAGVVSDAAGNSVIRRVDGAGTIMTFAGNGSLGYTGDGGPALVLAPAGLAARAGGPAPAGPITLAPGSSTTFTWTLNAAAAGSLALTGSVSGSGGIAAL
ncbi:MAG: hypothetical protein AAB368_17270, partial [bacterium]